MTNTDWHASHDLLARFADDPGALDDMAASSIEAHLVTCADCRRVLSATVDPALAAASWEAISDHIDQPGTTLGERFLRRLGVDDGLARILAATPALRAVGVLSIATLAIGAALLSRVADAAGPFLVLAPLAPLAAVAVAFAPVSDPAGEAGVAAALHGFGLVVRRAAVVLAATFALLGLAALAVPELGSTATAWVLPALALSLSAMALSTWTRVEIAAGSLSAGWMFTVWSVRWFSDRPIAYPDTATFQLAGQSIALAVALAAAAVLLLRRDRYATVEAF